MAGTPNYPQALYRIKKMTRAGLLLSDGKTANGNLKDGEKDVASLYNPKDVLRADIRSAGGRIIEHPPTRADTAQGYESSTT